MKDPAAFDAMWTDLADVGYDKSSGGYYRFCWTPEEATLREWFVQEATRRMMTIETDRNGNLWASTGGTGRAVVTGSHLDSVPGGGAFDGPLGIASAFAAIDELDRRGVRPTAPVGIVAFAEEEGARFGVPCLGSRLLTGSVKPERVRALRDEDGITWDQAMRDGFGDPDRMGPEPGRLARIGAYLELHIEQGRGLVHTGKAIGVASGLRPHGRWRLNLRGQADHAGTAALADRHDPMLTFAQTVLAVRHAATRFDALATVGRCLVDPGGTNVIPRQVSMWLDIRAKQTEVVRAVLEEVVDVARRYAAADHLDVTLSEESFSPAIEMHAGLTAHLAKSLGDVPVLDTGAGHDAGTLAAAGVPTAMLFVRNPTGVSHAPEEHAETDDCHAGVTALADAILLAAEALG